MNVTDRRTDSLIAYAALHYSVSRPEIGLPSSGDFLVYITIQYVTMLGGEYKRDGCGCCCVRMPRMVGRRLKGRRTVLLESHDDLLRGRPTASRRRCASILPLYTVSWYLCLITVELRKKNCKRRPGMIFLYILQRVRIACIFANAYVNQSSQ